MTPDQIESLVDDSLCINTCIPQGMQLAVLINLFGQIAGIVPPAPIPIPCTNLIPGGATYENDFPIYDMVFLTQGNQYTITWGANESELSNLGVIIPSAGAGNSTTFIAASNVILFAVPGGAGTAVTATVCAG